MAAVTTSEQQFRAAGRALDCVPGSVGGGYDLRPGTFYRLNANLVINRNLSGYSGAHSDIHKPEVAWAAGLRP